MSGSLLRTALTLAALASTAAAVGYLIGRSRPTHPRSHGPFPRHSPQSTPPDLLGATRNELAARFGPPVTASAGDYSLASIWYYPIDHPRRAALAIEFHNDRATHIELINAPS